jgi:hypothetical protein
MTQDTLDRDLRRKAERRADAKIGFRIHLLVYALVNAGLFAINMITSPGYLWFMWPTLGWGVGVLAHGLGVYGTESDHRERLIESELEKLRARG